MSRAASLAPAEPPSTEPAVAPKLRALSPQPNGEDAPTPLATIASTSGTPAPDAVSSRAPTVEPDEKEEKEEVEEEVDPVRPPVVPI